jgi:predicted nuclease of predicted toxin-antitoxin system
MRFLVDMPLSPELAAWLQAEGHDAIHASAISLYRAPDAEILQVAADQNRVIITADLDFPRLLASLRAEGPGLILLRGGNYSEVERRYQRLFRFTVKDLSPKTAMVSVWIADVPSSRIKR